jgi:hypothetical protein
MPIHCSQFTIQAPHAVTATAAPALAAAASSSLIFCAITAVPVPDEPPLNAIVASPVP